MGKISRLKIFADELIRQKRITRAIEYTLLTSFILLSAGIVLAIPLRYFMGIDIIMPLSIYAGSIILSFIYGLLGIENPLEVLKDTDARKFLNQKMSAAFQYGDSNNPYSSLLVREAEDLIENLSAQQVFHVRFSRRDPFQPLLLALFLFLWMSSFSLLQISDQALTNGQMLIDTSLKIDAVNSDEEDRNLEDIAEEYRKLGQKIQDQFMSEHSIEKEVDKLSRKLENKIEGLSRKGVDKQSQTFDEDLDSEIFQLNRKKEMSDELNDILQSLMKTFSLSPDMVPGGVRKGDGNNSGNSDQESAFSEEKYLDDSGNNSLGKPEDPSDSTEIEQAPEQDSGKSEIQQESNNEGAGNSQEPGSLEGTKNDEEPGTHQNPFPLEEPEDDMAANNTPGTEEGLQDNTYKPLREEKESGEFDDGNIRGELQEGEQMKSFIRALPHIVDPTLEEMEVLYFYRNQLENAIDRESLPENYQSVVRDYFLSIGVLNE